MAALGQAGITKDQLISLNKDLAELCLLQHSVAWFVAELNVLRVSSDEPATPATPSITEPMSAITPFTPSLPQVLPLSPDDELKLPLSRESSL
jgi:exocyst complex component 4